MAIENYKLENFIKAFSKNNKYYTFVIDSGHPSSHARDCTIFYKDILLVVLRGFIGILLTKYNIPFYEFKIYAESISGGQRHWNQTYSHHGKLLEYEHNPRLPKYLIKFRKKYNTDCSNYCKYISWTNITQ